MRNDNAGREFKAFYKWLMGPLLAEFETVRKEVAALRRDIKKLETKMAGELDRLTTEVSETGDAVDSAITLLKKLAELIRTNAGNPAALTKLADDLDAKQKALADAIVENTPADPDAPPA